MDKRAIVRSVAQFVLLTIFAYVVAVVVWGDLYAAGIVPVYIGIAAVPAYGLVAVGTVAVDHALAGRGEPAQ